jgi:hypothetical protein
MHHRFYDMQLDSYMCVILENLSTITKTESLLLLVLGKPKTKSIEISVQCSLGIGKRVYKP